MRFGGHETFFIREGWLHKGLDMLKYHPEHFSDPYVADYLGVGRNMAKSIKHWLLATGLADKAANPSKPKVFGLAPTDLAKIIDKFDPSFIEPLTWWVLHVNLVHNGEYAASWKWFFNHLNLHRFTKPVCVEGLRRYLYSQNARMPADRTLDRDLDCLLKTYGRSLPAESVDPEDAYVSPFTVLNLMAFYPSSGYYELDRTTKNIPPAVLLYALAKWSPEAREGGKSAALPLVAAARNVNGPGRTLALTSEALFELAHQAEEVVPSDWFTIGGLAGERLLRVKVQEPNKWLEAGYELAGTRSVYVA